MLPPISMIKWAVIAAVVAGLSFKVYTLTLQVGELQQEVGAKKETIAKLEGAIATQNALIEANRAEYEKHMAALPAQFQKIDAKYASTQKALKTFQGNTNADDSNASMQFINSFVF